MPLGAATTVGMFQNMYGDTNAMIKKEVFLKVKHLDSPLNHVNLPCLPPYVMLLETLFSWMGSDAGKRTLKDELKRHQSSR